MSTTARELLEDAVHCIHLGTEHGRRTHAAIVEHLRADEPRVAEGRDPFDAFVAGFKMRHEWPAESPVDLLDLAAAVHATRSLQHKADVEPLRCESCRDEALSILIALGAAPRRSAPPAPRPSEPDRTAALRGLVAAWSGKAAALRLTRSERHIGQGIGLAEAASALDAALATPPARTLDPDAILARYERAAQHVIDLCDPRKPSVRWTMRIPAEPDRDSDLVIMDALKDIPVLLAALRRADAPRVAEGDSLGGWMLYASDLSNALLAMGHHNAARHQSPNEYDAESGLACSIRECLAETVEALDFAGPTFPLPAPRPPEPHPVLAKYGLEDAQGDPAAIVERHLVNNHAATVGFWELAVETLKGQLAEAQSRPSEPDRTAALVEALRRLLPSDAIIDSCGDHEDIEVGYRCRGWEAREWRALADTEPAPVADRTAALTGWRHAGVWGSGECDGQSREDMRVPCGCKEPAPAEYVRCRCGHPILASLPAPRPPEPDRTAALEAIFCTGCDRLTEYGHADDCPRLTSVRAESQTQTVGSNVNDPASFEASEVVRMLEGIRRDIELMGEDGECSLRTIRGVQYVTKDDAMLAVDDRLGVVRLRALAATPEPAPVADGTVER